MLSRFPTSTARHPKTRKADPSSGQVGRLGSEGSSGDPVGFHPPLTPAPPKGDSGDVDALAPSAPKVSPALTLAALHRGSTRQDRTETVLPSSSATVEGYSFVNTAAGRCAIFVPS